jgi:hypothetical protein
MAVAYYPREVNPRVSELVEQLWFRGSIKGKVMKSNLRVDTTLGDLIVALTEEAARCVPDEKTACRVVAFILSDILSHTDPPTLRWH